jgi:hypothetical protein
LNHFKKSCKECKYADIEPLDRAFTLWFLRAAFIFICYTLRRNSMYYKIVNGYNVIMSAQIHIVVGFFFQPPSSLCGGGDVVLMV